MTQISEQESLTNKTYLTKNISESDISDYIKKKMPVYTKSLNEPPTSRLWASFIGRNLILGPVADLLAIKAYDKGTMADLLIAHLFTTVDDTKNLVKRYDDKKIMLILNLKFLSQSIK